MENINHFSNRAEGMKKTLMEGEEVAMPWGRWCCHGNRKEGGGGGDDIGGRFGAWQICTGPSLIEAE